ncbi:hypothetical protein M3Y98_00400600 [Aphelenchoides besseyi]|nr:hypothetical protein M3Y98_00400600 [Aphelenchoides besseyi]
MLCPVRLLITYLGLRDVFDKPLEQCLNERVFKIREECMDYLTFTAVDDNQLIENSETFSYGAICSQCLADILKLPKACVRTNSTRKGFALQKAMDLVFDHKKSNKKRNWAKPKMQRALGFIGLFCILENIFLQFFVGIVVVSKRPGC